MRPGAGPLIAPPEVRPAAELDAVRRVGGPLPAEWLEEHAVLPLHLEGDALQVGTWLAAPAPLVLDELRLRFGASVTLRRYEEAALRSAIRRVYAQESSTAEGVIAGLGPAATTGRGGELPLDDLVHLANEAPVVRLVNLLILEALDARASDVHLEAFADGLRVRYRVDGVLQPAPSPPAQLTAAVISRLKIMAELDIAERRLPQDGRIRLRLQDRTVDVRVATAPTLHGESVVLRLLDRERGRRSLADMGMGGETLARFSTIIGRTHGIVLVTGPTGSGKTTTLYGAIDVLRTGREKIVTVEDPIEYELPGVPQVPVNDKVGVTFASTLRALLRQDPDILLVGEIRDAETAQVATQAALTGHLVLSTLHTNDAPSAITRLLDLGVAPYLVASTVEAVLAQRLVRVLCPHCRREADPDPAPLQRLGPLASPLTRVWRAVGCPQCRDTGYRGRQGVFELLVMSESLRELTQARASGEQVRAVALQEGMQTLRDDGVRLVRAGVTSLEEVLRVTSG
ncbi:MAG: Flp pilus assembly complex ATPase component TadA [Gemmatimonas sp.]|uniref:GspE/PulE family protein n=1 Tax=Gemmatimonas sp. TaxID=1962908 RepID=UPI0031B8B26B|nr:Flp pilus assembly complex ATPase component TadA [Gemmatimonas sp.]